MVILSILILLAVLDDSFYSSDDTISYIIVAKLISNYLALNANVKDQLYLPEKLNNSVWNLILNETDDFFPMINMTAYQNSFYSNPKYENYSFRSSELGSAMSADGQIIIVYSTLYDNQLTSLLNIIKTLFLCLLVTIATVYFESDVKRLVLDPLEVMIEIIDKVSKDPIQAKNLESLETGMKTTLSKMNNNEALKAETQESFNNSNKNNTSNKKNKNQQGKKGEEYEVKIIQSAIMKISALLAIGIGEAGNDIIKENISNQNDLDPMMKGRKKNAIFGFCDIRSFPLVNEVLQENTIMFVNEIADIVHSSIDLFNGSTNKNIGDAFLLVWKLPNEYEKLATAQETKESDSPGNIDLKPEDDDKKLSLNSPSVNVKKSFSRARTHGNMLKFLSSNKLNDNNFLNNINPRNNNNVKFKLDLPNEKIKPKLNLLTDREVRLKAEINKIADSAVFGFLKIILKINRDLRILSYRNNQEILKQIENFKVNMGFGLHMGWAIEGAIGSKFKIDASYLSPNVNMAARLEAATRQYGVSILISGLLYDILSEDVKGLCRLIDIVTVKGSTNPIKLYTIDINDDLKPSKKIKNNFSNKEVRIRQINKKKALKQNSEVAGIAAVILNKKHFRKLLKKIRPKAFYKLFSKAFEKYIEGNWTLAANKFEKCLEIFPEDGPAKTLLKYIQDNNSLAPSSWKGYRALTSK